MRVLPDAASARILILDDQQLNIELLVRILERAGFYNVRSITDPLAFTRTFLEYEPDLVLLDLHMPGRDGFSILKEMEPFLRHGYLPVLMLTGDDSTEAKRGALSLGAKDFLAKPFDATEVLLRIRNLLETRALYRSLQGQNNELEERVHDRTRELERSQSEVLERLAGAAEFRDGETSRHTERVGELSGRIATHLGFSAEHAEMIRFAARLHDIGKIGIPDGILLKPGALSKDEFAVMITHTIIGARILSGGSSPVVNLAETIALSHHERWDGAGYPHRLRGEEIPIEARIVAVADVLDALSHSRPYRDAWPIESVLSFIEKGSGTQFDPLAVEALMRSVIEDELPGSEGLAVA